MPAMRIRDKVKKAARDNLPYLLIFLLVSLLLFFYLFNRIVITIGPGEAGVLFRPFWGGTVVDRVYPEGVKFLLPWNRMYIYNVRVQQVPYDFFVLSKNGLRIDLSISIRYHPEYELLGVLHKKVGPDYVNAVVIPEIENVLRVLLGRLDAEEVYRTRQAIIEKSVNTAIDEIARRYVRVDDVLIKKLRLPDKVEKAIQDKMTQKHIADAYQFRLQREKEEASRKRIEAAGLRDYNEIVGTSLSENVLQWLGVRATLELSKSENSKVVVIGSGEKGLPIIGAIPMEHAGGRSAVGGSIFSDSSLHTPGTVSQDAAETGTAAALPTVDMPPDGALTPAGEEKKEP